MGAVICFGMLCNALLKLGGTTRVVWRGTAYRGHELDQPADDPLAASTPAPEASPAEDIGVHVP